MWTGINGLQWSTHTGTRTGKGLSENQKLVNELDKAITRKIHRCRVYSPHWDNIWGADLAGVQLISIYNKRVRLLLCVIDIYSKYTWVVLLKVKKGTTITDAFQKKIW